MNSLVRTGASVGVVVLLAVACAPVSFEDEVLPPANACPANACDGYKQEGVKPSCQAGRCEADRAVFDHLLVASMSTTSVFAAGQDFLLRSRDIASLLRPNNCPKDPCFKLPTMVAMTLEVSATQEAATFVQFGLASSSSPVNLPSSAEYRFVDAEFLPAVRARKSFEVQSTGPAGTSRITLRTFLPPGRYVRAAFPDPPFANAYPPAFASVSATNGVETDFVVIGIGDGRDAIDDTTGNARVARITRSAGLDGFSAYLADAATGERISSVRPLTGLESVVRLDTVGANDASGVLRQNVNIVVEPSAAGLALPTLVDSIINGTGFIQRYPELPAPSSAFGRVVGPSGEGVRADVVFESQTIDLLPPGRPSSSLRYQVSVGTDATGAFRTVLPGGTYTATILPERFGRASRVVAVAGERSEVSLQVEPRAALSGFLRTADDRPLARAEVLATPTPSQPERPAQRLTSAPWAFPRPSRATVGPDGRYDLVLDEGTYDLVVKPAEGSGFPWLVSPDRRVSPGNATLEPLVVPAPMKIAYTMFDPFENPIRRTLIRAYAAVGSSGRLVEIGRTLTGTEGAFEILVAPPPK